MRILLVHNYHRFFGGDDAVVNYHVELLAKLGHEVEIYSRHNDETASYGFWQKVRLLTGVVYSRRSYRELSILLTEKPPDLVIVHNVFPLLSPSVYDAAHDAGIPMVQLTHDMRLWCVCALLFRNAKVCELCKSGNFWHAVVHSCYRGSRILSACYALSLHIARHRGLFQKITAFFIPSPHIRAYLRLVGVDDSRTLLQPHIIKLPDGPLAGTVRREYVAYLGRLSEEKGIWLLIDLARRLPEVSFKIAGAGPDESSLKDAVKNAGLSNIVFVGFLSGTRKTEFLRKAKVLVVPSLCYEAFGLIVLEAYACGTPVVAASHGGLAHLVKDGETGRLHEPGDLESLVAAVKETLDNDRYEKLGQNASTHYWERFAENVCIDRLARNLETVVSGPQDRNREQPRPGKECDDHACEPGAGTSSPPPHRQGAAPPRGVHDA